MFFESVAFAMGGAPAGGAAPSGSDMLVQFVPLILMFAIFWFLLIRPQQKKAKEHKKMLEALKKGDYVITSAGLIGRILEIDNESLLLETGTAKIRVGRPYVGNVYDPRAFKDAKEVKESKDSSADDK